MKFRRQRYKEEEVTREEDVKRKIFQEQVMSGNRDFTSSWCQGGKMSTDVKRGKVKRKK